MHCPINTLTSSAVKVRRIIQSNPMSITEAGRYSTVVLYVQCAQRQYVFIYRSVKCLKITIITKSLRKSTTNNTLIHQHQTHLHRCRRLARTPLGPLPIKYTELAYEYTSAEETDAYSVILFLTKRNRFQLCIFKQIYFSDHKRIVIYSRC